MIFANRTTNANNVDQQSKPSILIVDDAELIRELLSINLTRFGYETTVVADGQQALELIQVSNFDIVLLDIIMPDMHGIEVLKRIRRQYEVIELPVIMVTAVDESAEIVKALECGANDYITKPIDLPVVLARLKTHLALKNITQQLEEKNKMLAQLATTDELTGIPNRRVINQYLEHEWERAIRYHTSISIIFIDIDYFKAYNDTYGHKAGDTALRTIAIALPSVVRRKIDLVARYGGEEFVIILPDTDLEQTVHIAEQIRIKVEQLAIPHKKSRISDHITVSSGVNHQLPVNGETIQHLLNLADERLYKAKAAGRNQVIYE